MKRTLIGKKLFTTTCKINCWFKPIYESPRGLSICDLFANFSVLNSATNLTQTRCKTLTKNMKSRFLRILLIINGILIPIFILYVLGNVLIEKYNDYSFYNSGNSNLESLEIKGPKYEIKQSSLIGIPSSENYLVAEYKKENDKYGILEEEINLPYEVPKNTFNIIFLDKEFSQIRKLLKNDASIKSMFISNTYLSHNKEMVNKLSRLSFYIATEDTNNDGEINNGDQHYVYVSDLNGENLTKVSDRKVKQYEWVNENKEILLNFVTENNSEFEYGIYNIENKTIKETKNKTKEK